MSSSAPIDRSAAPDEPLFKRLMRATEIDTRMIGMVAALALIWVGFNIYTYIQSGEGLFLTPRNLWNLMVQTSSVAVMATGMVLVIVMRHIDLSVGSIVAFVSTIVGITQVYFLPKYLGLDHPAIWILTRRAGAGDRLPRSERMHGDPGRLFQHSRLHRHAGRTIVLARRSVVGDLRRDHRSARSSLLAISAAGRPMARSARWELGFGGRRLPGDHRRPLFRPPAARPLQVPAPADVGRGHDRGMGCFVALGATAVVNAYPLPERVAQRYAEANHIPVPEGGLIIRPATRFRVLIALAVGLIMTFVAKRLRFGRYVYAIGGNPEAAVLAGINTRCITVAAFALMGTSPAFRPASIRRASIRRPTRSARSTNSMSSPPR